LAGSFTNTTGRPHSETGAWGTARLAFCS
jgi:hypothetical protein